MIRMLLIALLLVAAPLAAVEGGLSATAETQHYYSAARLTAVDAADPGQELHGALLFIDGQLVGASPVDLKTFFVDKPGYRLEARMDGRTAGLREGVALPAEGELRIALADGHAGRAWTVGGLALGLGLAAASLLSWEHNPGTGAVLMGCGLGSVALGWNISWLVGSREETLAEHYNKEGK